MMVDLPTRLELIDKCRPDVLPLCAEFCARAEALGIDPAYFLLVPSFEPGGACMAAAACARMQPLLNACKAKLQPEVSVAIRHGLSAPEPRPWRPHAFLAELPPPLRRARLAWMDRAAEAWGVSLRHGFDVPVFGPGGWRGLFRISAPEDAITPALMRSAQEAAERFHRAYVQVSSPGPARRLTELEARALQLIAAGQGCKEGASTIGVTSKAVEKALERARVKLEAGNTTQAVLRAYQWGMLA